MLFLDAYSPSTSKKSRRSRKKKNKKDSREKSVGQQLNEWEEQFEGSKPSDYFGKTKNGKRKLPADCHAAKRNAIYFYFKYVYRRVPEEGGMWDGRTGIASRLATKFLQKKILEECLRKRKEFVP